MDKRERAKELLLKWIKFVDLFRDGCSDEQFLDLLLGNASFEEGSISESSLNMLEQLEIEIGEDMDSVLQEIGS